MKWKETQNKKDEYTYYKQNTSIIPPAYKTNLEKTYNSNFAI